VLVPDPADQVTGTLLVVAFETLPIHSQLQLAQEEVLGFAGLGGICCLAIFFWRVARSRAAELDTRLLVAEERLHLMRDRALAAAGLAHETKNPLGTIRGLAQICEDGAIEGTEVAGRIVEEVDRTVSRINEFLEYSRPREPQIRRMDLTRLLHEVRELILAGGSEEITLHVEAPDLTIKADAELLRQALFNLAANAAYAVKESPRADRKGTVFLRSRRGRESRCEIAVADNGTGIAAEDLNRIFNPYFSRRKGGTGLGLAIVRDIVEAHGWTIAVVSSPAEGAEFIIQGVELG
jgi:signal transduction histidine kinase